MRTTPALVGILLLASACAADAQRVQNPDPARFKSEIDAFAAWDSKNSAPADAVLFVGSSSIRMWNTADAFGDRAVINRGFGGAHISDMLAYFDRIAGRFDPWAVVFYCGDNDVTDGKPPEQVVADFEAFRARLRKSVGPVPVVWIPIKPSVARWSLREPMQEVNRMVAEAAGEDPTLVVADIWTPMVETGSPPSETLFLDDGLHLSREGYDLWNRIVEQTLEALPE